MWPKEVETRKHYTKGNTEWIKSSFTFVNHYKLFFSPIAMYELWPIWIFFFTHCALFRKYKKLITSPTYSLYLGTLYKWQRQLCPVITRIKPKQITSILHFHKQRLVPGCCYETEWSKHLSNGGFLIPTFQVKHFRRVFFFNPISDFSSNFITRSIMIELIVFK